MARVNKLAFIFVVIVIAANRYFENLNHPNSAVFDEAHYAAICDLYQKGQFHIDGQPPLAKLILCYGQKLLPHGENIQWENIQNEFRNNQQLWNIRSLSAMFAVFLLLTTLTVIPALQYSIVAGVVAAVLMLYDPAITVQGRLMLCDSIFLFLQFVALTFTLQRNLLLSALFTGMSLAAHLSSISTWILIVTITLNHLWNDLTKPKIPLFSTLVKSIISGTTIILLPVGIYAATFYLHFELLPNSGPHNHLMSAGFQTTLNGGLGSGVVPVTEGAYITLKSKNRNCYLFSDEETYPSFYEDETGSSGQQVVSCTQRKSRNNWWMVVTSNKNSNGIADGDVIQLIHAETSQKLNSHTVAAPITKHHCEVTCYIDYGEDFPPYTDWELRLRFKEENATWMSLETEVHLVHTNTSGALVSTHEQLVGYWGMGNLEVGVSMENYSIYSEDAVWVVEEIKSDEKPVRSIEFSFFNKLWEANTQMLDIWSSTEDHRFTSEVHEWPLAMTTIAYYHNATTNAQMHLVGNPVSWIVGLTMFGAIVLLCIGLEAKQARSKLSPHLEAELLRMWRIVFILGGGWILHMVQHFASDHPKFMYSYLPSLIFLHILHACAVEAVYELLGKKFLAFYLIVLLAIIQTFNGLKPVIYAWPVANQQLREITWWRTWDFFEKH